jgi:hypothetical protein
MERGISQPRTLFRRLLVVVEAACNLGEWAEEMR